MDAEEFFKKNEMKRLYIDPIVIAYIIGYSNNLSDEGEKDLIIITPLDKRLACKFNKITQNIEPWKYIDKKEDHISNLFEGIRNNGIYYVSIKDIEKLKLLIY